jgi:uncharacterized membrane protein YfcA
LTVKPLNRENRLTFSKILVAFLSGFILGWVAGLVGAGGGEFRIPILLHVLGLPLLTMIPVNLLVGLLTVSVSFVKRFQLGLWNQDSLRVSLVMSVASIVGAYLGAELTGRIPEKPLKVMLSILLITVGLKIMVEPLAQPSANSCLKLGFIEEFLIALSAGLAIGIISGMFGVAGGEFRIPVLMYVFGFNVITAGTVSLLISIPTIASGLVKHYDMKHLNKDAVVIAITMGAGSVFGAFAGALYVETVGESLIKIILGAILILVAIRMMIKH